MGWVFFALVLFGLIMTIIAYIQYPPSDGWPWGE
jgi:hypothetical protein